MAEYDSTVSECADAATDPVLQGIAVSEPEDALPRVTLDTLPEAVGAACRRAGWQNLMPVQSLALPYLLAGRDIMVQSRTGSGKTGCYLLPMPLTTREDRLALLESLGVSCVLELPFTRDLASLEAGAFVQAILAPM